MRFEDKDGGAGLRLCQQALAIGEGDGNIGRILSVSTLKTLGGAGPSGFGHLPQLQERCCRGLAVTRLGSKLTQAAQVLLAGFERNDLFQHDQGVLFVVSFKQFFKCGFVRLNRQPAVGSLQQLAKADSLLPGRLGIASEFFVGEAGAGSIPGLDLPLKHLSQQADRVLNSLQGQTKVGCHLPHRVIGHVDSQDLEIFLERIGSFPFLQKLFRMLYQLRDLGSIHAMRSFCHERALGTDLPNRNSRVQWGRPQRSNGQRW